MNIVEGKRRRVTVPWIKEPEPGLWSNCFVIGNMVVIAGMVGRDADGNIAGPGDPYKQSIALFERMRAFVEAAGGTMADIVKLNAFLADIRHRPAFIEARRQFFSGDFPPCVVVGNVAFAQPEYLVEVEAMAIIGSGS